MVPGQPASLKRLFSNAKRGKNFTQQIIGAKSTSRFAQV